VTMGSFRHVAALGIEHKSFYGLSSMRPAAVVPIPTSRPACCR
jgi:hypothetical protein